MCSLQLDFNYKAPIYRRGKAICKVEDCNNTVEGFGYCSKHYQEYKRYKTIRARTHKTPNNITVDGDIAYIDLYNKNLEVIGRAIIDANDIDLIKNYKWWKSTNNYVKSDKDRKKIYLHRLIMDVHNNFAPDNYIDHINRNPLDNRRCNLRLCTNKENMLNSISHKKRYPIKFVYNL